MPSSETVAATASTHDGFSVQRIDVERFQGRASPVMGLDHYRMRKPTFAPHPHAGFSAISYLFEDSPGALRNRDSLGHDFIVEPGGLVWTQAGAGVVHDELPALRGKEVHGLQIFVNQRAVHKQMAPAVFRLAPTDVPVWRDDIGNSVRVVVGEYDGVASPISPVEPFNLLDLSVTGRLSLPVDTGWNALLYVVDGAIQVDDGTETRTVDRNCATVVSSTPDAMVIRAIAQSRVIVLSGPAIWEPVAQHGPFIMNSAAEIDAAVRRYHGGGMGRLEPVGV